MQKSVKIIFHIDLNAFYASCAMIKEPYLRNKVFVVGGPGSSVRGVISTASYKARKYGIHSGMNMTEATKLYPRLLVVPADFEFYRVKSNEFMDLLSEYTDLMVQASIDEAYLDVTEKSKEMHPLEIAKEIQQRLLKEHQLPCSIGIAPTLFLAKMASDLKKPLGITVIRKRDVEKILFPLPISDMFGIGKKTYPKLEAIGIHTIGDFADPVNRDKIVSLMSERMYMAYLDDIYGRSSDVIDPDKYALPKSISSETTFNYDMNEPKFILDEIHNQLKECIRRLKKYQMKAKTVGFRLKKSDFTLTTRSVTLKEFTDDEVILKDALDDLFESLYDGAKVRLAGAHLSNLTAIGEEKISYNLFTYEKFLKDL
jgi:DNA polymerase-4